MTEKKLCRPPYCNCANLPGADWEVQPLKTGDFEVWYFCQIQNKARETVKQLIEDDTDVKSTQPEI
jgi:hypothetical protein